MANKTIYLSGPAAVPPKRRMFYKIFGALIVIFSGYQIYGYILAQSYYSINFISLMLLFVIGVGILFTGFQVVNRKTNQYISFKNNSITYKPSFLKESRSVDIESINEIVFTPTWVLCISDKEKFLIDLSWVASHITENIKEMFLELSEEKQINVKGHYK